MNRNEFRDKMSSNDTVPCLFCTLKVFRSDMPRIGVCKICYVKDRYRFRNFETWEHFLKVED